MPVYFIQRGESGPIKIGFALRPSRRIKSIQTGCAEPISMLRVADGGLAEEAATHEKFKHIRLLGEWFSPAQELIDFINSEEPIPTVPRATPQSGHTFADIVGLWPTVAEFAGDLGVSVERARKWASRNSIPGEWFMAVTAAAQRRGFDHVTTRVLSKIADDGRSISLTVRDEGERPVTGDAA